MKIVHQTAPFLLAFLWIRQGMLFLLKVWYNYKEFKK